MIKPQKLKRGDKIASVSLSWGGAGDNGIIERYKIGKKRLQEIFGIEVVEMKNTLKGSEYLYKNPKARAEDMMQAFEDKNIKAVFCNIGGDDTIRLLPYINYEILKKNPKVFLGYSDTTINHFMCYKAGFISFYGPSILEVFAENVEMHDYSVKWIEKILFSSSIIGEIKNSDYWTSEYLDWSNPNNNSIKRQCRKNNQYELIQGTGIAKGKLIGGCFESLEMLKSTELWPDLSVWDNKILFLETSEEKPSPTQIRYWLRNYAAMGIFNKITGIIIAKPYDQIYYEEYKNEFIKVICEENGNDKLPILYNMNFGHTSPMCILPYNVEAEIDCSKGVFRIIESAVVD